MKQIQRAGRHHRPAAGGRPGPRASSLLVLVTQATELDDPLPCHRENPRLWFSDLPAELQHAKAHCQPCPIRQACLAGAAERREPHGVWGGEIFAGGVVIAQKRPRGRPARRASAGDVA